MARSLVMIPTYNEKPNLRPLIEGVLAAAPMSDVMIVDDGSPDGTAEAAEALFGALPNFFVLRRRGPRGLGRSYADAYQHAVTSGYVRIVQMDADLSHDPRYLPELLHASESADVVIGSRYCAGGSVHGWTIGRRALSWCANLYLHAVTHLPVLDATSGYRCYTRRALRCIPMDSILSEGFSFQVEMTLRAQAAGLRITEIPIAFVDRRAGASKMTAAVIAESVLLPWRLRSLTYLGSAAASRPRPGGKARRIR